MINRNNRGNWVVLFGIILIIACGAYFRFVGINWDDNYHLHPDERFLTMVETAITPVESAREYFDTNNSSLNPHNVIDVNGNQTFPFFVYGTLPIFLVRYIGEFLNQTSYSEIHIIGRYLSGIFDLGTIILVFFIAKDLFKSKRKLVRLCPFRSLIFSLLTTSPHSLLCSRFMQLCELCVLNNHTITQLNTIQSGIFYSRSGMELDILCFFRSH